MAAKFSFQNFSGQRYPTNFSILAVRALKRIEKITGKKWGEVSLVLVKTKMMRQLNGLYRHQDKVTDVLSFTYRALSPVEGEIIICLEQARAQAKSFGSSLKDEMEFLFVHGCLHLLGFDHIKFSDRKKMEVMESKILGRAILGRK